VKRHEIIDQRSLALARAVVAHIERDLARAGVRHAQRVCARWLTLSSCPTVAEWAALLEDSWPRIRSRLLEESEDGQRLRQSSPFCSVLRPQERLAIYRTYRA